MSQDIKSLVDNHLPKIARLARILASRPGIEHRELAQAGVLAMLEASVRYKEDAGEFWPFVYPRVRGAMLDFLGRFCHQMCHVERTGVRILSDDSSEFLLDSERALSNKIDLERAMRKLNSQQQRVFLALKEGHRPKAIAGMMRISPRRFRKIQADGLKRLREELLV